MYHQFDRSMHPRQSVLKTIHTLKETSQQTAQTLQALQNVSAPTVTTHPHTHTFLHAWKSGTLSTTMRAGTVEGHSAGLKLFI